MQQVAKKSEFWLGVSSRHLRCFHRDAGIRSMHHWQILSSTVTWSTTSSPVFAAGKDVSVIITHDNYRHLSYGASCLACGLVVIFLPYCAQLGRQTQNLFSSELMPTVQTGTRIFNPSPKIHLFLKIYHGVGSVDAISSDNFGMVLAVRVTL